MTPASTFDWFAEHDQIAVVAWPEPASVGGHAPTDPYVSTWWLPVLGPSTTWALRHIAVALTDGPASGVLVDLGELSRSLGLGRLGGRHDPIRRALVRLVQFRLASLDVAHDVLNVRTVIPTLTPRQADHLPRHLRAGHTEFLRSSPTGRRREAPPRASDPVDGQTPRPRRGPAVGHHHAAGAVAG